jgi:hypothetical protein
MDIITGSEPEATWYTPDFEDNRDRPVDAQAQILLTPMRGRDLVKVEQANLLPRNDQKIKDVGAWIERRQWAMKMKCLDKYVTGVKNWFQVDAKTKKRKDIADFAQLKQLILDSDNAVLLGVLNDTFSALIDSSVLEEGMAKN